MGELDDLREEIEEIREEIEELKESSEDSGEEDEEEEKRYLYVYIEYVDDVKEFLGMEMESRQLLLLEEENSYHIPTTEEALYASTTRQVIQYIKRLGIDCWDDVRRVGEREDSVYYRVDIPEDIAFNLEEGAWVDKMEAMDLVTDMESREYL